mgnify:CR=1 FL=1
MANYKKSFSFRHGVQVDNDNFIVNTNGLVGIGTTVPTKQLDVRGDIAVSGSSTITTLSVSGISTFSDDVKIGTGITFDKSSNTIFAPNIKIGTSPTISNIVGYSITSWILNAAGTGIATDLVVGIGTSASDPNYDLVVTGDPDTLGTGFTGGNIKTSGIITASSFSGTVNVNDLSGIIGNDHIPDLVTSNINIASGISTFLALNVTGTLTGTASTAQTLTGTPDITVGITTVSRLKVTNIGIGTESPLQPIQVGAASTENNICVINEGKIGIGTTNPSEALEIYNNTNTVTKLTSGEDNSATVSLGSTTLSKAELKYDSLTDIVSLKNYSGKDIQFDVTTTGGNTGGIVLKKDNSRVFGITSEGKVSINKTSGPADGHSLEVIGTAKIGGGSSVAGSLVIDAGGANEFTITGSDTNFPIDPNQNLHSVSGITTLNDLHIFPVGNGINGINISGEGIGKTVAIGTNLTLFDNNHVVIGTSCTVRGDLVLDEDLTINKDVRIGTGATYVDPDDGTEIKLIVNQTAEFNRKVSFASTITGITTTPAAIGIGTTGDPIGVGTTASVSFTVPDWARSTRVSFTRLSTGLNQRGFRLQVNDLDYQSYNGNTFLHFITDSNQPTQIARESWNSRVNNGCFVGIESSIIGDNEFGRFISASGSVDFSILDPSRNSLQIMVSGIINLESINGIGIVTHSPQATLSGFISLGATTFSKVSVVGAGNTTGEFNNFLHVGIGTFETDYGNTPALVNVTHFR